MQRLPKWTRPLVQTAIGATASYGVGVTSVAVGRHLTNSPVIVIAAGGSGGHVLPAVAVAEQLDKDLKDWQNHQVFHHRSSPSFGLHCWLELIKQPHSVQITAVVCVKPVCCNRWCSLDKDKA